MTPGFEGDVLSGISSSRLITARKKITAPYGLRVKQKPPVRLQEKKAA